MPVNDIAPPRALRRDAQRNLDRLVSAAREVFAEQGLGAPLDEIARRADVSPGTLHNRFPTREALIDAIVDDLVGSQLVRVAVNAAAIADAWDSFVYFVTELGVLQQSYPVVNDVVSLRYPTAARLDYICRAMTAAAAERIAAGQRQGVLRSDFTTDDLFLVLAGNAGVIAHTPRDSSWRRSLEFTLDGLRAR